MYRSPDFQQYFTSATSSRRKYFILKDVRNQQIYRIKVPDIYLRDSIRNNAFTKNNLLVQAWRENNTQDNHDGKQDEGARHEGNLIQGKVNIHITFHFKRVVLSPYLPPH